MNESENERPRSINETRDENEGGRCGKGPRREQGTSATKGERGGEAKARRREGERKEKRNKERHSHTRSPPLTARASPGARGSTSPSTPPATRRPTPHGPPAPALLPLLLLGLIPFLPFFPRALTLLPLERDRRPARRRGAICLLGTLRRWCRRWCMGLRSGSAVGGCRSGGRRLLLLLLLRGCEGCERLWRGGGRLGGGGVGGGDAQGKEAVGRGGGAEVVSVAAETLCEGGGGKGEVSGKERGERRPVESSDKPFGPIRSA